METRDVLIGRNRLLLVASCGLVLAMPAAAVAETISGALTRAYRSSPELNVQRAATRVTDENIARAKAGYRPSISASADVGLQQTESNTPGRSSIGTTPRGLGITIQQNLFNGYRTRNSVRQATSQILSSRQQLRNVEQNVLANAAQAYMNVLRDTAILNLRRNNIRVLQQQLQQTNDRFQVGEVTRTDVAQAEAALAQGRSDAFVAQNILQNSLAVYRQLVGVKPRRLAPARPLAKLVPRKLNSATAQAQRLHPAIIAALHNVDVAQHAVKIAEGALYPSVNVTGSVQQRYDLQNSPGSRALTASIIGQLNIPIYSGGLNYANIRQAKQQLGQTRLQVDLIREQVRAAVVSAWGSWENSLRVIQAQQSAVRAAEIALNGVREEARVGQRTTFDVLNAQQALLNSRVQLVIAQRDRVVGSYALLAAMGTLTARKLHLKVRYYNPSVHYHQIKDKLWGTQTPGGR